MSTDYLSDLKYTGIVSRLKRLSDSTIADGRKLYKYIDIGIEPNWFLVFGIIKEKGTSSISEITSILKFAHPSVISIVRKMEKAGYLTITSSKTDKRKQVIALSKKAKLQLPEMEKVWEACEIAVRSIFKDDVLLEEIGKLERALEKESFFNRVLNLLNEEEIRITPFTSKDSKSFADLNKEWLNKYFVLEPIDKIVLGNPIEYIIEKGGSIHMAQHRDITAGTVALLPINKFEVELCKMAVSPHYQRKGIGKKLIEKTIEVAKAECYTSIVLYSNTKLKPAINLYKKLGFITEPLESKKIYKRADIKMRLKI